MACLFALWNVQNLKPFDYIYVDWLESAHTNVYKTIYVQQNATNNESRVARLYGSAGKASVDYLRPNRRYSCLRFSNRGLYGELSASATENNF